jgi:2-polyprenyl-3-methyl-5-hydroxy-6-metoxy-1,4-benzoquinol methylase
MELLSGTQALVTREQEQADRVRRYYGAWAATYGDPDDDGLFSWVRAREARLVDELLALTGGESILDAGCGSGVHARPLAARGHEVWAVDFTPEMVERVVPHVARAHVADVTTLALGRTFDRILCLGVLEFVSDPLIALRRLHAHLAPGGLLVVLVPRNTLAGRLYQLLKARHGLAARLHSPSALRRAGATVGLDCVARRTPFFHNVVMAFRCA